MWEMFSHSAVLFLQGKLFRDPNLVLRQWVIGVAITAALMVLLVLSGVPFWFAIVVASFAGGMVQPYLFKDLKYN